MGGWGGLGVSPLGEFLDKLFEFHLFFVFIFGQKLRVQRLSSIRKKKGGGKIGSFVCELKAGKQKGEKRKKMKHGCDG